MGAKSSWWFLLLLIVGCGNPIPPTKEYQPMAEADALRVLKEHSAVPVDGHEALFVKGRAHKLKDCSQCHDGQDLSSQHPGKQAHGEIKLQHAKFMDCSTCHVTTSPSTLAFGSERVGLDQAYQMCSSCHSSEGKDFLLGAHGKRITGWKGPRVIKNCTSCHNPHEPSFKHSPTIAHPQIIPERLSKQEIDHE
jgi:hypothetical protein